MSSKDFDTFARKALTALRPYRKMDFNDHSPKSLRRAEQELDVLTTALLAECENLRKNGGFKTRKDYIGANKPALIGLGAIYTADLVITGGMATVLSLGMGAFKYGHDIPTGKSTKKRGMQDLEYSLMNYQITRVQEGFKKELQQYRQDVKKRLKQKHDQMRKDIVKARRAQVHQLKQGDAKEINKTPIHKPKGQNNVL